MQNPAISRIGQLIEQTEFPTVAYQASRDILDRTLGKPVESMNMNVSGDEALIAALYSGRKRAADSRKA